MNTEHPFKICLHNIDARSTSLYILSKHNVPYKCLLEINSNSNNKLGKEYLDSYIKIFISGKC